jgi:dipeptidyl aminopeptidase/acylaminoacyl peptidase
MPTYPMAIRPASRAVCVLALPFFALLLAVSAAPGPLAAAPKALATQPDIHGGLIAFVHAEDVWTVPVGGGVARRLTFHEGEERYPKFSADGKRIAFTAEYDGNTDVYVMTAEGGDITRVTYHPGRDEVVGWHPDPRSRTRASRPRTGPGSGTGAASRPTSTSTTSAPERTGG